MTKKDYVKIAQVINFTSAWYPADKLKELSLNLSEALQADNPRFDRARFLTACGVNE